MILSMASGHLKWPQQCPQGGQIDHVTDIGAVYACTFCYCGQVGCFASFSQGQATISPTAASATTAARIETENNAAIVPILMGGLYLADKGITAYHVYQDIQAFNKGEKSLEQIAQERGEDYIVGLLAGNLVKHGYKAIKQGGKWVAKAVKEGSVAYQGKNKICSSKGIFSYEKS